MERYKIKLLKYYSIRTHYGIRLSEAIDHSFTGNTKETCIQVHELKFMPCPHLSAYDCGTAYTDYLTSTCDLHFNTGFKQLSFRKRDTITCKIQLAIDLKGWGGGSDHNKVRFKFILLSCIQS